jgi:hypothetical protein
MLNNCYFILTFSSLYDFFFHSLVPPRDLDPRLAPKTQKVEKLFEGEIIGAEGFHVYNGQLYSGLHNGYIIRIEEDRVVPVKFGKKCGKFENN